MAKAQLEAAGVYMPPRGMPIANIAGYAGYPCRIIGVGPTRFVSAYVTAPAGVGPYKAYCVENVPYVDGDTPAQDVPPNGGYVAPVGFTPPAYTPPAPPHDANGNAIIPETIWANPHTLPSETALNTPNTIPIP